MSEGYDAIVIGGGQAGPSLAVRLSQAGARVALIERKWLGGTCVNTGCKPTKTMVASAFAARMARRAAEFGVTLGGPVGIDMAAVRARKDKVVRDSRASLESWIAGAPGVDLIRGQARFLSPTEVAVDNRRLSAPRIFINVGGRAAMPPLPGITDSPTLDNRSIMELESVPEHLVVVGGSYIGLEFAQMFRRFGAEVTVIEKGPRLIGREDTDVSDAIAAILEAEGIALRLHAECIRFEPGIEVHVDCQDGAPSVRGSHVLLAMGRRPNTDDLGLEAAGVRTDAHGYIEVDDSLRTSQPGIWAMGDCNGRGAFTHTAYNDFEIVAANLLDGETRRVTDRLPCYALYTDPPLGRVGLTETQARASGRRILIAHRPMTQVGRAVEKSETQGFMKILVDADSRAILGASILGTGGDEVVQVILAHMAAGAPVDVLRRSVPIHPTVAELLPTLVADLKPLI